MSQKSTNSISACKKRFSKLNTYSVDLIDSTYVQVQLMNPEISKQKHKNPTCLFSSVLGIKVPFDNQEIRMGWVVLGIKNPEVGQYIISCVLYENDTAITYETGQNDILYVLNSFDLKIKSVALEKEENMRRVGTSAKSLQSTCFYIFR